MRPFNCDCSGSDEPKLPLPVCGSYPKCPALGTYTAVGRGLFFSSSFESTVILWKQLLLWDFCLVSKLSKALHYVYFHPCNSCLFFFYFNRFFMNLNLSIDLIILSTVKLPVHIAGFHYYIVFFYYIWKISICFNFASFFMHIYMNNFFYGNKQEKFWDKLAHKGCVWLIHRGKKAFIFWHRSGLSDPFFLLTRVE